MTPGLVIARRPQADEAIPDCVVETASSLRLLAVTRLMSLVDSMPIGLLKGGK
jgi:hypothetical protein